MRQSEIIQLRLTYNELVESNLTYSNLVYMQISNIISNRKQMQILIKKCLSIVENATVKDAEISIWIGAGVSDMVRQGIDVAKNISDELIQGAIVMYVKGNFGFIEQKEKELAQKTYIQLCHNLSLSQKYLLEVDEDA